MKYVLSKSRKMKLLPLKKTIKGPKKYIKNKYNSPTLYTKIFLFKIQ